MDATSQGKKKGKTMKLVKGNLWDSKDELVFVTANSYIRKNGELVMGRGAALELKIKRPDLPKLFGSGVLNICGHLGKYGIIYELVESWIRTRQVFGIFQVKYHFNEPARLDLIDYSVSKLLEIYGGVLRDYTISMNFPGIGFGGLIRSDILPIINILPDNVTIYEQ